MLLLLSSVSVLVLVTKLLLLTHPVGRASCSSCSCGQDVFCFNVDVVIVVI